MSNKHIGICSVINIIGFPVRGFILEDKQDHYLVKIAGYGNEYILKSTMQDKKKRFTVKDIQMNREAIK